MDKEHKNRSGSMSNEGSRERRVSAKRKTQPGASEKSNRQTGRSSMDELRGERENITKRGPNSI